MRYFKLKEFFCPCCKEVYLNEEFLKILDNARGFAGIPFKVNSGYRCVRHNAYIGGKTDSSHLKGQAADIDCTTSRQRSLMIDALLEAGFTRIGIAKTFIHADYDWEKQQQVVWLY